MGVLANARRRPGQGGRWIMVPKGDVAAVPRNRRNRLVRKRRQTFERLLIAAGATLLLGLLPPLRFLLMIHLLLDVAIGVYVYRLIQIKNSEHERDRVVRPLAFEDDDDDLDQLISHG